MRTEREMLDLILGTAKDDERIRAVIMNGSRADPNAPRDPFRDFDIVYIVSDVEAFKEDRSWIRRFGETMIVQTPDDMQDPPAAADGSFSYLMQFTDGNRLDLVIYPLERLGQMGRDSLSLLLLDKDRIVLPLGPANDKDYFPAPPNAKSFSDCCNEFWWVCPYVAKGLWRQEIAYAKHVLDAVVRPQLMKMLGWYIGLQTDFSANQGKWGKYFERTLAPDMWIQFTKTYADASYQKTWDALFAMCDLFRDSAGAVGDRLGFEYPAVDDRKVTAHLHYVRYLPRDATEIY